ncbi:MAG: cytochrome c [Actinomycetota bacterium]|nr:cytochrome c [Actinomycetota bacterium]
MTGLVIVLAFLSLGAVVVFVAMSGGPQATRRRLGSESRRGTKGMGLAVGVVVVFFGVAVPGLTFALSGDQSDGPAGLELNAVQTEGRELYAENCATCHTLSVSNAVGRVGPNLDVLRPNVELTLDAIANGRARGAGQMPADLVQGEQALAVAEYIDLVAGRVR